MAEVLAEHYIDITESNPDHIGRCVCGYTADPMNVSWDEHLEAALSAAGFGLVADAKAPEVRYATLTTGETELDEVVARNASVHLEAMDDNHWWLLVESGGKSVHVNFYTKRAKISGHAEEDS
jgi:hypothetical protein